MFYPCTAIGASLVRSGAPLVLFLALVWSAQVQSQPPSGTKNDRPAVVPHSVEVFGSVVDAETGKPVEAFVTQAGKFDPRDPKKKGRTVRGRVLDHLGKPVKDASLFAVRPNGMTLAGGRAVHSFDGEEDRTVRGAKTDSEGRFELAVSVAPGQGRPAGNPPASAAATPGLAVSSPALDAWPVPLPEGDAEAVIRLPPPTRVEIRYDIEASDEEASVFVQSIMHDVDAWKGFEIVRHLSIRNHGRIELTSLPPGRYQFARSRMIRPGNIGLGLFLDRQYVEVVSDKTTPVSFVRTTGTRLTGSVEWDEGTKLTGVIISVRRAGSPDDPLYERLFGHLFDARLLRVSGNGGSQEKPEIVGNRGLFLTERIPPGTCEVHADGYAPLTAEQERFTGIVGPTLTAQSTVTVPEAGVVPSLKLKLKKPAPPAERQRNAE